MTDIRGFVTVIVPLATLAILVPASTYGDDVYLTNGRVFEGVVTELTTTGVRIELDYGVMTLPLTQLLRIEEAKTPLLEFQERRRALLAASTTMPTEWLELAKWAQLNGLEQGHREVALLTAELAPELDGVAPMMRGLGYAFEADLGRWITHREAMRRQGLVRFEGAWISPLERSRRMAARAAESASREARRPPAPEPAVEDRRGPSDRELAMAQLELFRDVLGTLDRSLPGFVVLGHGSILSRPQAKGGIHPTASSGGTLAFRRSGVGQSPWDAFLRRQPGSFLPLNLDR